MLKVLISGYSIRILLLLLQLNGSIIRTRSLLGIPEQGRPVIPA